MFRAVSGVWRRGFLTSLVLLAAGCSATNSIDYGKVTLVSVSGTVTLDGQPLPGALVTFENEETGSLSFARTNSSGSYTLQFDSEKDGVTPGTKRVRFSTVRTMLGLRDEEGEEVVPSHRGHDLHRQSVVGRGEEGVDESEEDEEGDGHVGPRCQQSARDDGPAQADHQAHHHGEAQHGFAAEPVESRSSQPG